MTEKIQREVSKAFHVDDPTMKDFGASLKSFVCEFRFLNELKKLVRAPWVSIVVVMAVAGTAVITVAAVIIVLVNKVFGNS